MTSRILCFVGSFIRSFNWPATSATFDVTDEVIDVARERNEETPFVGEEGADVTLDLDAKAGSDLGGSADVPATGSPGRGGVADVGRPGGGDAFALLSSSSSPDRSPCENLLFRYDVVVEKRWLKLENEILATGSGASCSE